MRSIVLDWRVSSLPRRGLVTTVAPLAALRLASVRSVAAAELVWPARPVRIVTFGAAGGGTDAAARCLAEALSRRWGQPVLVENRPGADGIIAVDAFLAGRDGHSLLFVSSGTVTVNPLLHAGLLHDPAQALLPVAFVVEDFMTVIATPSLGLDSLAGLVALARQRPGTLNWAAVPGPPYLAFLAFAKRAGIELAHVPYRNPIGAIPDIVAGRVELGIMPIATVLPQVEAGKLSLLAVAAPNRAPAAPATPSAAEAGFPDLAISGGLGLFLSRGDSPVLVAAVASAVQTVLAEPEVATRLARLGYRPRGDGPEAYAAMLAEDHARWAMVARAQDIRPQP